MQVSPGFWSPGVDSWRSCEGSTGVRGSEDHRRRGIARAGQDTGGGPRLDSGAVGLEVEGGSLGNFLATRRSCCGSWPELGCTGATGARRRRGLVRRSRTGQRC
jgi:hypothetical protein